MDLDLEKYKKIDLSKYKKLPDLKKYRDDSKTGLPQVKASIDTLQEELQKVGKIAVDALNKKPVISEKTTVIEKTDDTGIENLRREIRRNTANGGRYKSITAGENITITEPVYGSIVIEAQAPEGTASWGGITGTLSAQTDLMVELQDIRDQSIAFAIAL